MKRHCKWLWLWLLLLAPLTVWGEPQGRVRATVDIDKVAWMGQRVLVHLDLLTTGFSFSGQRFDLPQISGGVLLQTDSSTLKLTEKIEGESWQILRYDLSLFIQREGNLEIPPVKVHFSASSGYGQPEVSFDLDTEPVTLQVRMPPGADASRPVVTSPRLSVEQQWQPDQSSFRVGDALMRTITISAEDVSAIALPAAPNQKIDGIDLLTEPPVVEDKTNRGTLTGRRQEQISYLFRSEGSYTLPGGAISWWNPESEILEQYEFEERSVDVAPNPMAQPEQSTATDSTDRSSLIWFVTGALLVLLLVGTIYWTLPWWRKRREEYLRSESARFRRAMAACRKSDTRQAWATVTDWFVHTGLAPHGKNQKAWTELQRVLVSGSGDWSGSALANTLTRMRREMLSKSRKNKSWRLQPLNP